MDNLLAAVARPARFTPSNALGRNVSTSPVVQESMSGGLLRTRVGKALALGGGLFVLIGGGAYAVATRGSDFDARHQLAGPGSSSTAPTTAVRPIATEPTTSTTAVPEPTTEAPAPPPREGDPSVKALQQRLAGLGYDIGPIDGFAGSRTYYTIMAFQKVEGLKRTGEDSDALRDALAKASPPGPVVPGGAPNRVEIDLDRQVLLLWKGGALTRVLSVSTGSGEHYCVDGECDTAITPTGTFRIGRKASGLEVSRLGELWDPMYFYGGIAIHGSPSIPGYPASHGCVRVPMYSSAPLYAEVPSGTLVYVVGNGPSAAEIEAPPDEPKKAPDPPPPPPPDVPVITIPPTTTPPLTVPTSTSTTPPPTTSSTTVPASSTTSTTKLGF